MFNHAMLSRPSSSDLGSGPGLLRFCLSASCLLVLTCWRLSPAFAEQSSWAYLGQTGRMIYRPDAQGDRILDFSTVGFRGRGTALLPDDVPVKVVVSPGEGDDTSRIQAAIDQVASLPAGPNGFRGAVLLEPGAFDIEGQIQLSADGVVLRGSGASGAAQTVLHARGTNSRPLIRIAGSGGLRTSGPTGQFVDKVVPVGATSFRIDSTSAFAVGDSVRIVRPSTGNWISDIGMDRIPPRSDGQPIAQWAPGDFDIRYDRVITRIEEDRVFIDSALTNSFELKYGGGTISRYTWPTRAQNIGVENLHAQSDFASPTDDNHAWDFVFIDNAENVFVRDATSAHFAFASVNVGRGAKWVTVDNVVNLDPKSSVSGGRRYSFNLGGQLELVTNSQANLGRHDFVNNGGAKAAGPHVFHRSVANQALDDSGPHQRWATGTLFDNVVVNGDNINARNRGNLGTGHGWSGANMVVWNSTADGFVVQNPPTAQNWLIGSHGDYEVDNTFGPQPDGYVDLHNRELSVESLYDAQMADSADIRDFRWGGSVGNWSSPLDWDVGLTPAVYRIRHREYLVGDIDGFAYDGSDSIDAPYLEPNWRQSIEDTSGLPIAGFDDLSGKKNVAFTIQHQLDPGDLVVHGYLALALRQSAGSSLNTDFVRLFDLDPRHRLNFTNLGWDTQIDAEGTFVGVIDLGGYLDKLQSGSINVQLNDDAGVDWATYYATVAHLVPDPKGTRVFLDGGGSTIVDQRIADVAALQVGGYNSGDLKIGHMGGLEITQAFQQLDNGSLALTLGADAMGRPVIDINGTAALGGILAFDFAGGYAPASGDLYQLLAARGGLVDTFDIVVPPLLPAGLDWELKYQPHGVLLRIIDAPTVGDYNSDGTVDAADYTVWRDNLGAPAGALPNDLAGGEIGSAQYDQWRQNYGNSGSDTARGTSTSVPEPASLLILSLAAAVCLERRTLKRGLS